MKRTKIEFSKVSFEQFDNSYDLDDVRERYDEITLPKRATTGSAGYDICTPVDVVLMPGESCVVPTGIHCEMDEEIVMFVFPRSSAGIKKKMVLLNTVGVIDSDYFHADNEGHIFVAIKNTGTDIITFKAGERFAQAVFVPFFIGEDDEVSTVRSGGIGSTGN